MSVNAQSLYMALKCAGSITDEHVGDLLDIYEDNISEELLHVEHQLVQDRDVLDPGIVSLLQAWVSALSDAHSARTAVAQELSKRHKPLITDSTIADALGEDWNVSAARQEEGSSKAEGDSPPDSDDDSTTTPTTSSVRVTIEEATGASARSKPPSKMPFGFFSMRSTEDAPPLIKPHTPVNFSEGGSQRMSVRGRHFTTPSKISFRSRSPSPAPSAKSTSPLLPRKPTTAAPTPVSSPAAAISTVEFYTVPQELKDILEGVSQDTSNLLTPHLSLWARDKWEHLIDPPKWLTPLHFFYAIPKTITQTARRQMYLSASSNLLMARCTASDMTLQDLQAMEKAGDLDILHDTLPGGVERSDWSSMDKVVLELQRVNTNFSNSVEEFGKLLSSTITDLKGVIETHDRVVRNRSDNVSSLIQAQFGVTSDQLGASARGQTTRLDVASSVSSTSSSSGARSRMVEDLRIQFKPPKRR